MMDKHICPRCHQEIQTNKDDIVICDQCNILQHKQCWENNGGCYTIGCLGNPVTTNEDDWNGRKEKSETYPIGSNDSKLKVLLICSFVFLLINIMFIFSNFYKDKHTVQRKVPVKHAKTVPHSKIVSKAMGAKLEKEFFVKNVDDNGVYKYPTKIFYITDEYVYFFMSWYFSDNKVNKHSKIEVKFLNPDGMLYHFEKLDTVPTQNEWNTWFPLSINGENAAQYIGEWKAEVYIDEKKVAADSFEVQKPSIEKTFFLNKVEDNGDYDNKDLVTAVTLDDKEIYYYIDWAFKKKELNVKHEMVAKFYDPNNDLQRTATLDSTPDASDWWTWFQLKIDKQKSIPGKWKVELFLDGTKVITDHFNLEK